MPKSYLDLDPDSVFTKISSDIMNYFNNFDNWKEGKMGLSFFVSNLDLYELGVQILMSSGSGSKRGPGPDQSELRVWIQVSSGSGSEWAPSPDPNELRAPFQMSSGSGSKWTPGPDPSELRVQIRVRSGSGSKLAPGPVPCELRVRIQVSPGPQPWKWVMCIPAGATAPPGTIKTEKWVWI